MALTGVGEIGKTAIAGRALSRLRAEGWIIAEHIGVWSPLNLIGALTDALRDANHTHARQELVRGDVDDTWKLGVIMRLLQRERLLLLDDFE